MHGKPSEETIEAKNAPFTNWFPAHLTFVEPNFLRQQAAKSSVVGPFMALGEECRTFRSASLWSRAISRE
jgi:hypothetical protein